MRSTIRSTTFSDSAAARAAFGERVVDPNRMPADLQQGQHQRGEFVAHRDAGEGDARRFAGQADGEGGAQGGSTVFAQADLGREFGDVDEQAAHFLGLGTVVERGDEFDRSLELFEVGGKLGLDGGVEHVVLLGMDCIRR